MIRLPQNRTFTQSNQEYFGDIFYSKNINLDLEGKLVLSPRTVSIVNSEDTGAFDLPIAYGVRSDGQLVFVTAVNPFIADLRSTNDVSVTQDTDSDDDAPPSLGKDSHGVWWQNRWYVVDVGAGDIVMYKTISNGNWTDTAIAVTDGKFHPLAVFQNRQTLAIGNGNQVLQYDTAHSASTTLTIPADFEVTKLAYNNNRMGVATKLDSDSSGQNGEAYFFVWDGASTAASAGFGVGANYIYDVIPYKSSFVVLTSAGEALYFNGAGFSLLFKLPVYYTRRIWTDGSGTTTSDNPMMLGDIMKADGDLIHLNLNGATEKFGRKGEQYLHTSPGGVWTFDPRVGLYHTISPSISKHSYVVVANTGVNTSTDVITRNSGTVPSTGSPMKYVDDPTDPIGGLTIGKVYYCIKVTATTFKLAETKALADAGTAIDLTSQATGTSAFLALEVKDYGQSFFYLSGGLEINETTDLARDHFVFGAKCLDSNSTTTYSNMLMSVVGFKNIGYFVTPKIFPRGSVEDTYPRVYIKHERLNSGDSIEVKKKTVDYRDIPVTTPQHGQHCTWSDSDTFTTTADLSEAKTLYDAGIDLECEVIAGAGAGQMSQIASITESSGTYTVNLDDTIEGVSASDVCDVKIENWKSVDIQADTETDYFSFPIEGHPSWLSLKVIMTGVDVSIEEMQIINEPYKPST